MKEDFVLIATKCIRQLYIPHGSDERIRPCRRDAKRSGLYIPHGSDERSAKKLSLPSANSFISHMVQMKENKEILAAISMAKLYIPHGSDESFHRFFSSCNRDTFISHMVQMKAASKATLLCEKLLYIPHGSDERAITAIGQDRFKSSFISHMVQMKD